MTTFPHDACPPISDEEAAAILSQWLDETEMLLDQEQCPDDWLRVQALRVALRKIGSGNEASPENSASTRRSEAP